MIAIRILCLILLPVLAIANPWAAGGDRKDLPAAPFLEYLKDNYPKKSWQSGPAVLDTAEVRAAFPGHKVWFVFSAPPFPPGAPLPDLIKAYQERMKDFMETKMSLSVLIDKDGKILPVRKPIDINPALARVTNDDEARRAAAAILSLWPSERVGPMAVAAKEVAVTKTDKGWTCTAQRKFAFDGRVEFDATGRCLAISKVSIVPLPP